MSLNSLPPISAEDKAKASEKLAKPIDQVKASGKAKRSKSNLIRIALILLMVVGIAIPAVVIYMNNSTIAQKSDEITLAIETENTEIKELVKESLVYSRTGNSTYYSPSLDASFNVDATQISVSEVGSYVTFYARTMEDVYGTIRVMSTDPTDFIKSQHSYREKFELKQIKQDANALFIVAGFTYEQKSFLKNQEVVAYESTVYYKKIADSEDYVYLEFRYPKGEKAPEKLQKQYEDIMSTFVYKPENVSSDATIALTEYDMQLAFDRKEWEVASQTDRSLALNRHTSDRSQPYTAITLRGENIYPSDNIETLIKDNAEFDISYETETREKVSITNEGTEVDLSGTKANQIQYSYTNDYETVYVTSYYGLSPNKDFQYRLQTRIVVYSGSTGNADSAKEEIANVLKGLSFEKVSQENKAEADNENVLGADTLSIEKPALLGKLSTVHIANATCATFTINDPVNLPALVGKSEEYCYGGYGTGFLISPEGHIVTNAHVASGNPFDNSSALFTSSRSPLYLAVAKEVAKVMYAIDPFMLETTEGLELLKQTTSYLMVKLIAEEKIEVTNLESSNYMELEIPFEFDLSTYKIKNPDNYVKLELLDSNELNSYLVHKAKNAINKTDDAFQIEVADLALLKVISPTTTYPALALGNEATLLEGESLLAIGFPGAVNNEALFSASSSTTATITRGIVSAIKDNPTNQFKLIQTDVAINHGNSGGPMIGDDGKVIAVSTYGVDSDSNNYNAGVSISAVKQLISKNGVSAKDSIVSESILSGMDNMQKNYYVWAVRDFDKALQEYPNSIEVIKPLKLLAQEKIDAGEDNSPIATLGDINIHPTDLPYVFGGLGIAILFFIILIVLTLKKRPRKRKNTQQVPPTTAPQMGQQTPPAPSPLPIRSQKPVATPTASTPIVEATGPKPFTVESVTNNAPVQSPSMPSVPTANVAPPATPVVPKVIQPSTDTTLPPMMQSKVAPEQQKVVPNQQPGPQFTTGAAANMATESTASSAKTGTPTLPPLNVQQDSTKIDPVQSAPPAVTTPQVPPISNTP